MRRLAETVADVWGAIERVGAGVILIVITVLYGLNVLVRAVVPQFASLFAWVDDAARYLMIWVVFLAAGVALEVGRHVSVDLVRGRFGPRFERGLFAAIDLIGLVFCVFSSILAWRLARFIYGTGQVSPTLGVPTFLIYVAPVVGFASLAFRFLLRLLALRDARRTPVTAAWLEGGEI
jgi:TRAP-type C4-dicarboxylate transport system permease small subunit